MKPARAGSSYGVSRVDHPDDLDAAIAHAEQFDPKIMVEAMVAGRELECGVLGSLDGPPEASVVGEVVVSGDHAFYDFDAKYLAEADLELVDPGRRPGRRPRARARAGAGGVHGPRVRGAGPGRLLLHRDRRGDRERAQHDAGLHAAIDVSRALGGLGRRLSGAGRPTASAGARPVRPVCADRSGHRGALRRGRA